MNKSFLQGSHPCKFYHSYKFYGGRVSVKFVILCTTKFSRIAKEQLKTTEGENQEWQEIEKNTFCILNYISVFELNYNLLKSSMTI